MLDKLNHKCNKNVTFFDGKNKKFSILKIKILILNDLYFSFLKKVSQMKIV
jgi:hypothetical protein